AKCYLMPPLPGGRECVWERGLGGEGLRRPAHPRPSSAAAIPSIHGSSAPPPPKSTSLLVRCARTSVGGDGSVRLDSDGLTAGPCAASSSLGATGPIPSSDRSMDLVRRRSSSVRTRVSFRRSRSRREALRRSICQRLYSASFSSTRKEVYSLTIEYPSPRRTIS